MQIKTTMRYDPTSVRMDIIKKTIGKDMEKREPSYAVGGNIKWYKHYGKQSMFSKNLKFEIPHNPGNPLLDIYLMKTKTLV